jgi:hydroxymethylpyrimidine/phosphomethylpyrimidine kinase
VSILTIAGFDPTGGAGILRDISIFKSLGIPYIAVPTAMTVQTSEEVLSTSGIPTRSIKEAFESSEDFRGVKIGMLYNVNVVKVVADFLKKRKPEFIVLDPIINSTSGYPLITEKGIKEMKKSLFPISTFVTPNLEEGKLLTLEKDPGEIAEKLHLMGAKHIIITGINKRDDLFYDGVRTELIKGSKPDFSFHGSGCFYSSYLLGQLILGCQPLEAAKKTKEAIEEYARSLKSGR